MENNDWKDAFVHEVTELKYDKFSMVYQPIFYVSNQRKLSSIEALMRYKHKGHNINPDSFIAFSEEHGLIQSVGDYALRRSLTDLSILRNSELSVNVNVSYQQFFNIFFAHSVIAYLTSNTLDPTRLTIEITESAYIQDFALVNETIAALRREGVKIAIDDFGSGYANLSLLSKIDYDIIKVDRSCVSDVCSNKKAEQVLKSIKALSDDLSIKVVIEGVESEKQLEKLRELGFMYFQGWLFSKPKKIQDFL